MVVVVVVVVVVGAAVVAGAAVDVVAVVAGATVVASSLEVMGACSLVLEQAAASSNSGSTPVIRRDMFLPNAASSACHSLGRANQGQTSRTVLIARDVRPIRSLPTAQPPSAAE